MDINDVMAVVNRETAVTLCLSKGGWEGWLQCELWRYLTIDKNESAEREVAYPGGRGRCDLVVSHDRAPLWVEIKCFGIFRDGDANRFMDSIAKDIWKLDRKPAGASGLALVVVPRAIGDAFNEALKARNWLGFQRMVSEHAFVYYMLW
jgi:hypothetical protein